MLYAQIRTMYPHDGVDRPSQIRSDALILGFYAKKKTRPRAMVG